MTGASFLFVQGNGKPCPCEFLLDINNAVCLLLNLGSSDGNFLFSIGLFQTSNFLFNFRRTNAGVFNINVLVSYITT